jgi:hypothetical protein
MLYMDKNKTIIEKRWAHWYGNCARKLCGSYPPIQILQYVRTKSSTNDFLFLHFNKPLQKCNCKEVVIMVEVA